MKATHCPTRSRTTRARRFGLVHALLLAGAALAMPAGAAVAENDATVTITKVDTSKFPTVNIEVGVPAGLVGTLAATDVQVTENGTPVAFTLEQVPANKLEVVLLLDTSGSMKEGDAMGAAKSAALAFLGALPPEVSVGVVSFDDVPTLVSGLTTDRAALAAAINGLSADGETSLYDGIVLAKSVLSGTTDDRQFVLLSDGGDTVSRNTLQAALGVTTAIRTSVIELTSSEANHDALVQLSASGNGSLSSASDPAGLYDLYVQVANALVNRYRLVVTSAATGPATYAVQITSGKTVLAADAAVTLPDVLPTTSTSVADGTATSAPSTGGGTSEMSDPVDHSSTAMLIFGSLAFFAAIGLAVFNLLNKEKDEAHTQQISSQPLRAVDPDEPLLKRLSGRLEAALEQWGARRKLADALDSAGISLRSGEFVVVVFAVGLIITFLLSLLMGPMGFIIGLFLTPVGGRAYVTSHTDKRRLAFNEQLPDMLQLLVSSLKAGYGLLQSLDSVSSQCPQPTNGEFQRVLFEVRIGRDLKDALEAMGKRMGSRDFDFVVSAIQINREIGGQLAGVLHNVAETIRERQRLQRQIRVLTSEGRLSVGVLTALPLLLAILLSLINRDYFKPMSGTTGTVMLVLAIGFSIAGYAWMRRIVKAQE